MHPVGFSARSRRGSCSNAELAARELGRLTLADALNLLVLIAKDDRRRYGRAAARWHGRFALEATRLDLADSQLALAALAPLPVDVDGVRALLERIGARHNVRVRSVRQRRRRP